MKLSVIVCTRNRSHAIIPCLDSTVAALTNAMPINAEIVVVDNGSTDDTPALLTDWAARCSLPVTVVLEPRKGVAFARNRGITTARGELFACTDDDCQMDADYITALLRHDAADGQEEIMRGGRVELGNAEDLPLTIKTSTEFARWSLAQRSARSYNLGDSIMGCNMAMRRSLVQKLGLFDTRLGTGSPIPGGEDTDYYLRAYLAGHVIEYAPDMVVRHHHGRKTVQQGRALIRNYMIGCGALTAKYLFKNVDLCRPFYWDLKKALVEVVSNGNSFLPQLDISHRDKLYYYLLGMKRYVVGSLRGPFERTKET